MNKVEAKEMITALLRCQDTLDEALVAAEKISVPAEREALSKALKVAIGDILTEAIMPIASQHPALNPYKRKIKLIK